MRGIRLDSICASNDAFWLRFLTLMMCFALSGGTGYANDKPYYARNPSGHGSTVAFEFNGHIWLQERGQNARRLTGRTAEEAFPVFSTDGQYLAFSGSEGPASEVFVTSLATGDSVRLTYDGGADAKVQGWLDQTRLIYSTTIKSRKRGPLLFVIDIKTHAAKPLPLAEASEGCVLGDSFVFSKNEKLIDNNRMYRGGYAQSIMKIPTDIVYENPTDPARPGVRAVELTASYKGTSRQPLCARNRIYFLSDRSGRFNIWSMDISGNSLRQHTFEDEHDIGSIALVNDGTILFQKLGDIFHFAPSDGKKTKVKINLPADTPTTEMIKFKPIDATELQISNDAERAFMVLRGDLWSIEIGTKKATCLECDASARVKSVRLDARGNPWALSDTSGEYKIYRFDLRKGSMEEIETNIPEPIEDISIAPNGLAIVATTTSGKLYRVDRSGGASSLLNVTSKTSPRWLSWAQDSRHLSLITYTPQDIGRVSIVDVTCNRTRYVTSGRYESYFPVFSSDGGRLFYISETNFRSTITDPWAPRNYWPDYQNRGLIYSIDLDRVNTNANAVGGKHAPSGCAAQDNGSEPSLRDYQMATDEMPFVAANYAMLFAAGDHPYAVVKKAVRDERGKLVDFPQLSPGGRQAPRNIFEEDIFKIEWSPDKHAFIAIGRSGLFAARVPTDGSLPQKIDLNTIEHLAVSVNRRVEHTQMFDEMWRLYRDYFWDPDMNGSNWQIIRHKYLAFLSRTSNRTEFNEVASAMVAELGAGHTSIRSPTETRATLIGVGRLGGTLSDYGDGVQVTEVYDGDVDLKEDRSPLSLAKPPINPGDRITHVAGIAVDDQISLYKLLDKQEGRSLVITFKKPNGRDVQTMVTLISADEEAFLRYRHWTVSNQKAVDRLSDSTVGYLHLYSSYEADMATIVQEYPSIQDRRGIIIDLRGNNGGNIDAWVLNFLQRKTWMYLNGRSNPILFKNPRDSFNGRFAILIDGDTYSNGELIAEGARRLGLGLLIGTRTSGAGIWVNSSRTLVDGGPVRIPESGSYVKEGGVARWLIEGEGVEPDVEVANDPYRFYHGEDDQLEAAVEYLMR